MNAALVDVFVSTGLSQSIAQQIADCMAPKMMEQVSAAGLNAIVTSGLDATGSTADINAIEAISAECVPGA